MKIRGKARMAFLLCIPISAAILSLAVCSSGYPERVKEISIDYSLLDSVVLEENEGCEILSINSASIENDQLTISGFMDNSITVRDLKSGEVTFHYEIAQGLVDSLFPIREGEARLIKGYLTPDSQQVYGASRKCIKSEGLLVRIQHMVAGYRVLSDSEIVLLTLIRGPLIITGAGKNDTTVLGLPAILHIHTKSKNVAMKPISLYPYKYVCGSYFINPACDTIVGGLWTLGKVRNNVDNPYTMFRYTTHNDNTYLFARRETTPWGYAIEEPVVFWNNNGVCMYSHGVEPYLFYMEDKPACALPRREKEGADIMPSRIAIRSISASNQYLCVYAMALYGDETRHEAHFFHSETMRYLGTAAFESASRIIMQMVLDKSDNVHVIGRRTSGEKDYLVYRYKIALARG